MQMSHRSKCLQRHQSFSQIKVQLASNLTKSQNRNPLSTSSLGDFTPGNVSSHRSRAISFATCTPGAVASRTLAPLLMCVSASKYTFANMPNPVFTSVWNGRESVISKKSSRACRASFRRSIFNEVTSNNVLSARVSDRTKELNTSNSRDNGADHGMGCERVKDMRISLSVGGSSIFGREIAEATPVQPERKKNWRTLKFKGTMLRTRITNNIHFFSSSTGRENRTGQKRSSMRVPSHRWWQHVPVPKLGPPLNARPDHKWPCITPALTSSKNK